MAKKDIDWEGIEREFRVGQLSNVEIGRRFSVSEGAIRKKAKVLGWKKDLTQKVRERVRDKIVRDEVRDPNATDEEIIEAKAERTKEVLLLQRKDIAGLRELEEKLIKELKGKPTKLYITQYQGKIIQKVVGLTASERAMAANNLANVQHKRIQLERQAYNIEDTRTDDEDLVSTIIYNFPEMGHKEEKGVEA